MSLGPILLIQSPLVRSTPSKAPCPQTAKKSLPNPLKIVRGSCVKSLRHSAGSNMAASRLEINFIRLMSRCESIASEKRVETEWRLEKVSLNHYAVYLLVPIFVVIL